MSCHLVASAGFATSVVDSYERGRPEYDDAHVDLLLSLSGTLLGSRNTADFFPAEPIVELACGTGKFTRPLVRALKRFGGPQSHANVILVDPAGMGSHAALEFPDLPFHCTTASKLGHIPDGSIRAVVAAQAFHWFADSQSLDEICRILQPGGALLLIWNKRDRAASPLMTDLEALLDESYAAAAKLTGPTPRHNTGEWRTVFETPSARAAWHPLEETQIPRTYTGSVEIFVDWMLSISVISQRDSAAKAAIAAQTRAILAAHPEAKVTTAAGSEPEYTVPLFTDIAWTKKRPSTTPSPTTSS